MNSPCDGSVCVRYGAVVRPGTNHCGRLLFSSTNTHTCLIGGCARSAACAAAGAIRAVSDASRQSRRGRERMPLPTTGRAGSRAPSPNVHGPLVDGEPMEVALARLAFDIAASVDPPHPDLVLAARQAPR